MKYKVLKSSSGIVNPFDRIQARFFGVRNVAPQLLHPPRFLFENQLKSFCSFSQSNNMDMRFHIYASRNKDSYKLSTRIVTFLEEGENESGNAWNTHVMVMFAKNG